MTSGDDQAKSKSSDHAHAHRNISREGTTSFSGLCSSSTAGRSPSSGTTCAAGGSGIRRTKSLDLERLALGVDISGVQSVGKLNNVAGTSGLCGLLLGDGFRTIIVLLNGNDGKGCVEN